jgi:hypothetical protein
VRARRIASLLALPERRDKLESQNQFRRLRRGAGLALDPHLSHRVRAVECALIQGGIAARQDLDFAQTAVSRNITVQRHNRLVNGEMGVRNGSQRLLICSIASL